MLYLHSRFFRRIPFQNTYLHSRCFNQQAALFNQHDTCYLKANSSLLLPRSTFHTSQWDMKTVSFLLADIGEGIQEVLIKEWYVKEGDVVKQFDNVCEVQSDKASVTITCRYDGIIQKVYYGVDDTAIVGKPLLDVEVEKEGSSFSIDNSTVSGNVGDEIQEMEAIAVGTTEEVDETGSIQLPKSSSKILTTPAVRRVAMEKKVDLAEVNGTGKDGRILKEDVLNYIANRHTTAGRVTKEEFKPILKSKPISITKPKALVSPQPLVVKENTTVPIKGYVKTMVKTMTASMKIPSFMYCDEVNMSNLIHLKHEVSPSFQEHQLKFSYMPFFLKAASIAMNSHPILNSSLDENCENITYKSSHNIGFAMDTPVGLVVPNIKNVQSLSILQITEEITRLMECGKSGSFSTHDLTGGTITISNVGSIGGTYTQPRILVPEVAIVGLGKIQRLPRFSPTGAVEETHIMNISWSADHRIIDGATLARFSNIWKNCLEKPSHMLIYLK